MDWLSWGSLTARPASGAVVDGLAIVSLAIFAATFVVLSLLALRTRLWGLRRRVGRHRFGRWLSAGLWLSSLGLILLIVRFLQIDPLTLSRPVWLLAILIGVAIWVGSLAVLLASAPAQPEIAPSHRVARRPKKGGNYR